MKHAVIVRPEAEDDLKGAFLWYEENRTGLGYDFLLTRKSISSREILKFIWTGFAFILAYATDTRLLLVAGISVWPRFCPPGQAHGTAVTGLILESGRKTFSRRRL